MPNLTPEAQAAEERARARVEEAFASEPPLDPVRAEQRLRASADVRRRVAEATTRRLPPHKVRTGC